MINDYDNHVAESAPNIGNDCDNHIAEKDSDNDIESVPYPSCVTCPSYHNENEHKSISTMHSNNTASIIVTLSTNASSLMNATLTTSRVHTLIDEAVESRKKWVPKMNIETAINRRLCHYTGIISL